MIDLIGKTLVHTKFGLGTVEKVTGSTVTIKFKSSKFGYRDIPINLVFDRKLMTFSDKKLYNAKNLEEVQKYLEQNNVRIVDYDVNPLTKKSLSDFGLLDDFYDLYCSLQDYYDEQVTLKKEKDEDVSLSDLGDDDIVRNLCLSFFEKYSFLFADPPYVIKPWLSFFINLQTYDYADGRLVRIQFSKYLNKLHDVVLYGMFNDPEINLKRFGIKQVSRKLNKHIDDEFEKMRRIEAHTTPDVKLFNIPIYVFDRLSVTRCKLNNHNVSSRRAVVRKLSDLGEIMIPVHYCENCDRYMIGRATLAQYDKAYEKILVRRIKMTDADDVYSQFDLESKLHQYGYNVVDGELTDKERHELLVKLLTYFEICSTIDQNIQMFTGRENFVLAVKKWQDDLLFLGEYIKETAGNNHKTVNGYLV